MRKETETILPFTIRKNEKSKKKKKKKRKLRTKEIRNFQVLSILVRASEVTEILIYCYYIVIRIFQL